MSLTAAASGFVVFFLSVQVIQAHNDWGVTYTSTEICAVKGSTVEIKCTYSYPSRINDHDTTVEKTFWFTKLSGNEAVDVRTDSQYAGRVQYSCYEKSCTLRITDLRERDSAEYKFSFITNQPGGRYTGSTGVTLSVTDLRVRDIKLHSGWPELKCHSSCRLPGHPSFIWYKNGEKISSETSYHPVDYHGHSYSCAVKGCEDFPSPPVCPQVQVTKVTVHQSYTEAELKCHSSCSPAAHFSYVWFKNGQKVMGKETSSYTDDFYPGDNISCAFKGHEDYRSPSLYPSKLPSVSVSPSAEIVEGSSVTLTCSSDANPAANYTWYKENEDSPKALGQNFTITDVRAEHSGNYYCEAQNTIGRHNSTLYLTVVAVSPLWKSAMITVIFKLTLVVVMLILRLLFCLWMRKKETLSSTTEPNDPIETVELESGSDYINISFLNHCSTD